MHCSLMNHHKQERSKRMGTAYYDRTFGDVTRKVACCKTEMHCSACLASWLGVSSAKLQAKFTHITYCTECLHLGTLTA